MNSCRSNHNSDQPLWLLAYDVTKVRNRTRIYRVRIKILGENNKRVRLICMRVFADCVIIIFISYQRRRTNIAGPLRWSIRKFCSIDDHDKARCLLSKVIRIQQSIMRSPAV
jgi:hypothetical protein